MRTVAVSTKRGIAVGAQNAQLVFERVVHLFQFGVKWITARWAAYRRSMLIATSINVVNHKKFQCGFTATLAPSPVCANNILTHYTSAISSVCGGFQSKVISQNCFFIVSVMLFGVSIATLLADGSAAVQSVALQIEILPALFLVTFCTLSGVFHKSIIALHRKHLQVFCWNYPKQANEHNALDDAKWNRELYAFIQTIKNGELRQIESQTASAA